MNLLPNHVQINHTGDVDGGVLICLSEVLSTEQALFFTCERGEDNCGFGLEAGKDSSELE